VQCQNVKVFIQEFIELAVEQNGILGLVPFLHLQLTNHSAPAQRKKTTALLFSNYTSITGS